MLKTAQRRVGWGGRGSNDISDHNRVSDKMRIKSTALQTPASPLSFEAISVRRHHFSSLGHVLLGIVIK